MNSSSKNNKTKTQIPPGLEDPFLQEFLRSTNEAVMIFDLEAMKVVMINNKTTELFGWSPEDLDNIDPLVGLPEKQPDGRLSADVVQEYLSKIITGEKQTFKWQQINRKGELFFTEVNAFKIPTKLGKYSMVIHKDLTPSIQSAIEIDFQKERFNYLYDNAFDGIAIYDLDKRRAIECNEQLLKVLNLTREEFFKSNLFDISHPIQENDTPAKEYFNHIIKQVKTNGQFRYRWIYLDENKQDLVIEISAFALSHPTDNFSMAILKNITAEREALIRLEKSQRHLLDSQTMAKLANFKYNVNKDELIWSAYAYKTLGLSTDNKLTKIKFFVDFIHPDDRKTLVKKFFWASEHHKSFETELRIITLEKEIIHCQFKAEPHSKNGQQVFFGTVQDITHQKVIMHNLTETSAKYSDLFENMSDALLIVDEQGLMVDVNKAAEQLLGYTRSELKLISIPQIVHPDDKELSQQYLQKLHDDGFYSNYMGRIIRKDGEVRYLQVNSTAIYKNGKFAGSRDIARDITNIKNAQKKREELVKELESVNQELKDFAHIVSHDLKAPLRAISSLSTWLMEDYSDELNNSGVEKLQLLNNRVHRMHNFIDGILEYSKIGRSERHQEIVDLNEIVLSTIDALSPPKHFKIEILNTLPKFYGHKTRLTQLFQNLLGNAIKYNDKAKGLVTISSTENEEFIQFSLADNGPGIPINAHERVFQIFKTLHARDDIESTGIGLTIVKRIVNLYQGEISIDSTPGQGACFNFSLKKILS